MKTYVQYLEEHGKSLSSSRRERRKQELELEVSEEARGLYNLIKEAGLSPYELSKKSGINHTTILRWLRGQKPSILKLEKICNILSQELNKPIDVYSVYKKEYISQRKVA